MDKYRHLEHAGDCTIKEDLQDLLTRVTALEG